MNPTKFPKKLAIRLLKRFPKLWFIFKYLPAIDHRTAVLKELPRNSVGAEIGVWKGDYSERIYYIVSPRKLYLVDPWKYDPSYPARMYGGRVAKSQKDMDAIFDAVCRRFQDRPEVVPTQALSSDFLNELNGEFLDFVYVDGNHSYDYVLEDLELSKKAIKQGGNIVGDDFFWKDSDGTLPIKRAVETFSKRHGLDYILVGNQFFIKL